MQQQMAQQTAFAQIPDVVKRVRLVALSLYMRQAPTPRLLSLVYFALLPIDFRQQRVRD